MDIITIVGGSVSEGIEVEAGESVVKEGKEVKCCGMDEYGSKKESEFIGVTKI